jgi:hypothetical protein
VTTMPCSWDVSCSMCSGWDDYPQSTKDQALWLASTFLWAATGRRFGSCPVTIRPVRRRTWEPVQYQVYPVTPGAQGLNQPGGPFLFGGKWFNSGCSSACCGNRECALVLRGPVTGVDEVLVDGEVVPASAYRVDVSRGVYLLVRVDGECWPTCQNLTADVTEVGTFEVTYEVGRAVPPALQIATGLLACEYAKSLTGGACALPARMTRLTRQGVEVEVSPPDPENGMTGIKIVDDIVTALNPGKRHSPPRIMSPDLDDCDRTTVVPAGS